MAPCAVSVCKNSTKNFRNGSFHRFPKDDSLRKAWIGVCGRKDYFNPDLSRICSEHFTPEDFERNFRFEITGGRNVRKLKSNAVPSLNHLPTNSKGGRDYVFVINEPSTPTPSDDVEVIDRFKETEQDAPSPEAEAFSLNCEASYESTSREPDYKAMCLKNQMEKRMLETRCAALSRDLENANEQLKAKEESERLLLTTLETVVAENERLRNKLKYV